MKEYWKKNVLWHVKTSKNYLRSNPKQTGWSNKKNGKRQKSVTRKAQEENMKYNMKWVQYHAKYWEPGNLNLMKK